MTIVIKLLMSLLIVVQFPMPTDSVCEELKYLYSVVPDLI